MGGDGQSVQQTLQTVVRERQVEILFCRVCTLLETDADGGRQIAAHAVTLSR